MFLKIINWVKTHKLLSLNIAVGVYILYRLFFSSAFYNSFRSSRTGSYYVGDSISSLAPSKGMSSSLSLPSLMESNNSYDYNYEQVAQDERKVITNSNLSLLVKNVDESVENIRQKTISLGGFMVNTNIRRDAEADKATLEVRIPSKDLVDFSKYLRTLSIKVVYENIVGTDITDQYTDYEEKLQSLYSVKASLQEIMENTNTVDEILNVHNRMQSIQSQIDTIKGQLTYMDRSTATSKVTIILSTDELSLPYTPVKSWRPDVIVKKAVRALISVFRGIGTATIWAIVFTPLLILFIALKVTAKYLMKRRKFNQEFTEKIN